MADDTNTNNKDSIILGSGELFLMEYDGNSVPEDAALETAGNNVGHIKGGAELNYTPTEYEVVDDFNYVVKRFITKEEVSFKSGILTWALENLAKLTPGKVTEDQAKGEKILKLGGAQSLKNYALRFVHKKDGGLKLRITMVATASSGFTLTFKSDSETVVDAQFKAVSQTDGTLVEIRDQVSAVTGS